MEVFMKKASVILTLALLLMMNGVCVFADMGMPESPKYKTVISIYDAVCYAQYNDYEAGNSSGTISGGQTFYVWGESNNGLLWGTTDPKGGPNDTSSFVYISSDDVMNASDTVKEKTGAQTEETIFAVTTDKLNVRCGPGTGFNVLTTLDKGTAVQYDYTFANDTTWVYVKSDNGRGWASSDYLKRTKKPQEIKRTGSTEAEPDVTDTDSADTTADTQVTPEENPAESRRGAIIGIILICIGAAILIATVAAYLLNKNRNSDPYR